MNSEIAEQMWLATMRMAVELKKAGMKVDGAFAALRSAKVILNECRVDPYAKPEFLAKAENIILEAQRDLFAAAAPLGQEFIDGWEGRLRKAISGEKVEASGLYESTFYPGLPRDMGWVRLLPPEGLGQEALKGIAEKCGAEMRPHEGGYVLITGKKETVKRVLKEISPYYKKG